MGPFPDVERGIDARSHQRGVRMHGGRQEKVPGSAHQYDALVREASALTPPEACDFWNRAEQALWRELDIAPIADRPQQFFLQGAEAQTVNADRPIPTSIRVLG